MRAARMCEASTKRRMRRNSTTNSSSVAMREEKEEELLLPRLYVRRCRTLADSSCTPTSGMSSKLSSYNSGPSALLGAAERRQQNRTKAKHRRCCRSIGKVRRAEKEGMRRNYRFKNRVIKR